MQIEHYSFGKVLIDGKAYTKDLIIYPKMIEPNWWRQEGHLLHINDLKDVMKDRPEALIIGTGYYGAMTVPTETVDKLRQMGVEVVIQKTQDAVNYFNNIDKTKKKVIAALHLTC
jgi:hypothetical protein